MDEAHTPEQRRAQADLEAAAHRYAVAFGLAPGDIAVVADIECFSLRRPLRRVRRLRWRLSPGRRRAA